ncbi:MAG TPA: 4'-phosphopantetheinyl transferase superfamily protein [Acidimicrobiales bacterium]|nr:4'-phosphopantetheinyl transferase superfamily protein [Acidimicrobiales bacterium]
MRGGAWPEAATVDVWVAPLLVAPPVHERLAATLSPAERERAARFRAGADRRRATAARGFLRLVLGAVLGADPAAVAFAEGPGKPRLGTGGPCFNLSHAGDLAAVAVARFEVGVDVEHVASAPAWESVAAVACSPAEVDELRRLPAARRQAAFCSLWTAKEAYLKGTGEGLAAAPDLVSPEMPDTGRHTPVGDSGWWVRAVDPAPGFVGAVAAEGRRWEPRLRAIGELLAVTG